MAENEEGIEGYVMTEYKWIVDTYLCLFKEDKFCLIFRQDGHLELIFVYDPSFSRELEAAKAEESRKELQ